MGPANDTQGDGTLSGDYQEANLEAGGDPDYDAERQVEEELSTTGNPTAEEGNSDYQKYGHCGGNRHPGAPAH
eukprot:14114163-Heterocapsa_arctica.AAC.1